MNGVETLSEMTLREMQGDELTRDIFFTLDIHTGISHCHKRKVCLGN